MQKVLVVDDDPEWFLFTCVALSKHYETVLATDGDEALAQVAKSKPDIVILDVMMPGGIDGFTTFCELRKNPETRAIPVIMLTAVNDAMSLEFDSEAMKSYLGSAPSAFLEKPVTAEELCAAVAEALTPHPC